MSIKKEKQEEKKENKEEEKRLQKTNSEEKQINKKYSEATSSQPYGLNNKEQALLLTKVSCQSTGVGKK